MNYHIKTDTKNHSDVIIIFYWIAILSGIVTNFAGLLPDQIKYFFYASSLLFGYCGIVIYLLTRKPNKIYVYWLFLIIYMLFIGIIRSNFFQNSFDYGMFFAQDLRYMMYFAMGISLANESYIISYHKIMCFLSYLSIIFGALALIYYRFDFSQVVAGARLEIWSISYYLWWLSVGVFAYIFPYAVITKKNKFAGYGAFAVYLVLGILFIKRSVFVNCAVITLLSVYFRYKMDTSSENKKLFLKKLITIIAIIIGFLFISIIVLQVPYINALFKALFSRFSSQGNIFEYDRAQEATEYFTKVSFVDIIFGQGIGYYINTSRQLNALHTGILNTIYKGGILYLLFTLILAFTILKKYLVKKKFSQYTLVCLCTSLSYLLSLTYEMSWTYTIIILGYATPIVYLITNSKEEDLNK